MKNKILILAFASFSVLSCKKEEEKKDGPKPYPVVAVETKNVTGYDEYPESPEQLDSTIESLQSTDRIRAASYSRLPSTMGK